MTRRVVEHHALTKDREFLSVITVFEEGVNKQQVRRLVPFSRHHGVLIEDADGYKWG